MHTVYMHICSGVRLCAHCCSSSLSLCASRKKKFNNIEKIIKMGWWPGRRCRRFCRRPFSSLIRSAFWWLFNVHQEPASHLRRTCPEVLSLSCRAQSRSGRLDGGDCGTSSSSAHTVTTTSSYYIILSSAFLSHLLFQAPALEPTHHPPTRASSWLKM